ncbi:hypothetical protein B0H13DRAFT_1863815 [Mycena leptocephala]|nr:hypothetical protein B0H13DRAFT_1863815 [Mycena leptocephala]
MPSTTVTHTSLDKIVEYLAVAASTIRDLGRSAGTPFLNIIAGIIVSLLTTVQAVTKNRNECLQLLEKIHVLLYAIITVHTKSEAGGILSPAILGYIGQFTETLQKIHIFIRAQQEKSKIRLFLQQSANNALLRECNTRLQQALDVFKVHIGTSVWNGLADMQTITQETHDEIMELISALSDGTMSDQSSMTGGLSNAQTRHKPIRSGAVPYIDHFRGTILVRVSEVVTETRPPSLSFFRFKLDDNHYGTRQDADLFRAHQAKVDDRIRKLNDSLDNTN